MIAALREWQRKAELSGDRAGLLAVQDYAPCLRTHMKLAGGAHLDEIEVDAFLEQADDYESTGDLRDGVLKLLNTEKQTHPFAVVRAAELRRWSDSDEYRAILAGDYPHRDDDPHASVSDSARDAVRSYKKRIDESNDPLVTTVRNVGSTLGDGRRLTRRLAQPPHLAHAVVGRHHPTAGRHPTGRHPTGRHPIAAETDDPGI